MTFGRYCEGFLAHGLRCKGVPCLSSKSPVAHAGVDDMIGPRPKASSLGNVDPHRPIPWSEILHVPVTFHNGIGGCSKLMEVA
jgi:hypothetical protein